MLFICFPFHLTCSGQSNGIAVRILGVRSRLRWKRHLIDAAVVAVAAWYPGRRSLCQTPWQLWERSASPTTGPIAALGGPWRPLAALGGAAQRESLAVGLAMTPSRRTSGRPSPRFGHLTEKLAPGSHLFVATPCRLVSPSCEAIQQWLCLCCHLQNRDSPDRSVAEYPAWGGTRPVEVPGPWYPARLKTAVLWPWCCSTNQRNKHMRQLMIVCNRH